MLRSGRNFLAVCASTWMLFNEYTHTQYGGMCVREIWVGFFLLRPFSRFLLAYSQAQQHVFMFCAFLCEMLDSVVLFFVM
jgi:hypothetical protein